MGHGARLLCGSGPPPLRAQVLRHTAERRPIVLFCCCCTLAFVCLCVCVTSLRLEILRLLNLSSRFPNSLYPTPTSARPHTPTHTTPTHHKPPTHPPTHPPTPTPVAMVRPLPWRRSLLALSRDRPLAPRTHDRAQIDRDRCQLGGAVHESRQGGPVLAVCVCGAGSSDEAGGWVGG